MNQHCDKHMSAQERPSRQLPPLISQNARPNGSRRQDGTVINVSPSTTPMRTGRRSPKQASVKTAQLAYVCPDIPDLSIDFQIKFPDTYTTRPRTSQTRDCSHIQLAQRSDGMTHWATNTVASERTMRCMFPEAPRMLAWVNRVR